jgi:hypothetical protein
MTPYPLGGRPLMYRNRHRRDQKRQIVFLDGIDRAETVLVGDLRKSSNLFSTVHLRQSTITRRLLVGPSEGTK